ncbi:MAG: radical SAM family heme chaperone HemW [Gemmatimonadaceae bacterium]|nr:radical SAM family heme chaperone HemW [Gemmatimonadaceae bacterium]
MNHPGQDGPAYRHLYVHVPFCARRCSYCDFSIAVRRQVPVDAFVRAVEKELTVRRQRQATEALETLYFGGGTPSLLGVEGIRRLLDVIRRDRPLAINAEITLEANPEDITASAVRGWRDAGITRLSIGVQSFDDAVLRWMHRVHDAASAERAVRTARDGGLGAFSLDLIFAVPDVLARDWTRDLDMATSLNPDHISLYGLTVEPHTPLGRRRARGMVVETTEERYEAEFLEAHRRLSTSGFEHYEVSNFARAGRRAIHNSAYWSGAAYLGVGPSAHGFTGAERRWNIAAYAAWQAALDAGQDPIEGREVLTAENRDAERAYLGLRTSDGMELSPGESAIVAPWVEAGWLEWVEMAGKRRARCTPEGWLRLDRLAADLTALPSHS